MEARNPVLIDIPERLVGQRVTLRPYRAEDARPLWEAIEESRARLEPWMPWVHTTRGIDDLKLYLARTRSEWVLRESMDMGAFDTGSGRLLGSVGFPRLDWAVGSFEIGYWIRTSAEGQGFIRESVQLLTRLAFEDLDANRVEIQMDPRNVRSRLVAERLGYILEGTLRNCALDGYGHISDRHVFALTSMDYRQLDQLGV